MVADVALDPVDIQARLDAYDRSAAIHARHQHLSSSLELYWILTDAESIYRWLTYGSETATRLIIKAGAPYEQGSPAPEEEVGAELVAITLTDTQQVDLTVQPVDSKGQPTDDSSLTWSVDNEDAISIVGADDGDPKTVTLVAGNPGVATVTVTDANGVTGAEAITVTAGETAAFNVVAGPLTEQPAATPPTDPAPPVDPTVPTDPTTPTDPTVPVDPTDPTTPVDPTDPSTPPVDPTDPSTPPVDPTTPTDGGDLPDAPVDPAPDPAVPTE